MKAFFRFIRNCFLLFILALVAWHAWQLPSVRQQSLQFGDRLTQQLSQLVAPATSPTKVVSRPQLQDKPAIKSKNIIWAHPQASVYLNLKKNKQLRQAALEAISAWNKTGVFTFTLATHKKHAQIVISAINDSDTNAAGQTRTAYNPASKRLVKAKIQLNHFYLQNPWYNYSHTRIVNTVEHELGHAIGLSHTHKVSVMYPAGSLYTIQPRDIHKVARLYHENKERIDENHLFSSTRQDLY